MLLITLGVIGLPLLLVAGVLTWASTYDLGRYQQQLVDNVRRGTGRELIVRSPLRIQLGWAPSAIAEGISLSNAAWGSRPEMATVKRVTLHLDVMSLFLGEVKVGRIVISGADLLIERGSDGQSNLEMAPPPEGSGPHPSRHQSLRIKPPPPMPWIPSIEVEDSTVVVRESADPTPISIAVERFVAGASTAASALNASFVGSVNRSERMDLQGRIGNFDGWMRGLPGAIDVKGTLGEATLTFKGEASSKGSKFDPIVVEGPTLAVLGPVFELPLPDAGPFSLTAKVLNPKGSLKVELSVLKIGSTEIKGEATFRADKAGRPTTQISLETQRLDLADFRSAPAIGRLGAPGTPGGPLNAQPVAPPPAAGKGAAARPRGEPPRRPPPAVIPEGSWLSGETLPLERLRGANTNIALRATEVVGGAATLTQVNLTLGVSNARLVLRAAAGISGGQAGFDLSYDATQAVPLANLSASISRISAQEIFTLLGEPQAFQGGLAEVAVALRGPGRSVREVAGAMTGTVDVALGPGAAPRRLVPFLTPEWERLLAVDRDSAKFSCANVRLTFARGVGVVSHLTIDGPKALAFGGGFVSLRNDSFEVLLAPEIKDLALMNAQTALRIKGGFGGAAAAENDSGVLKGVNAYWPPGKPAPNLVSTLNGLAKTKPGGNPCQDLGPRLDALRPGLKGAAPATSTDRGPRRPAPTK